MISAKLHNQEEKRLAVLKSYNILDSLDEEDFNEIVELASEICETPISLISLIDENRQWFKAKVGLNANETDRTIAFCAHAILQDEVFIIEDSFLDERFKDNPLAVNSPNVRFYAGAPLINKDGFPLGTLCAIDSKPRKLSKLQIQALKTLSHQVVTQMELRLAISKQQQQVYYLEKLNRDKDRFFSIISHDLRSPFNALLGISQVILDDIDSFEKAEIIELVQNLNTTAQSAYKLVDNLLNWSLLEGGVLKAENQKISTKELLQDVEQTLKAFASQKDIEFIIKGDLETQVFTDRNMFRSILLNLSSNAIKFTPKNGLVEINATKINNEICFSVKDSGVGIPSEKLQEIKNFGECKSTTGTFGEPGSGLGLKLCYEFVTLLDSKLFVKTEVNIGTIFSFNLKCSP